ncbi:CDP-glycerol glycerophosphotransferase family protein [Exiguobacterium artemiae]|uniref:CDP-glycerol glycerophosphotransferase family protein n=1 Tax=Exiguobacterium artemiae TaxID=340145 RepID=UPI003D08E3D2
MEGGNNVRESIVQIYLLLFRIFYRIFCLLPVRPVTLFWVTYGDNVKPINDALLTEFPNEKRYLIYDKKFVKYPEAWSPEYALPYRRLRFIRLAYLLATSKHHFIDNYIGEYSVAPIRKGTKRIQLWHAAGTLKKFGLTSSKSLMVPKHVLRRFKRVYRRYGDFIVPGDACAGQFMAPHDLPRTVFKTFGMPRTDYWFDEQHQHIKKQLCAAYVKKERRIILYAPTYREYNGMEGQTVRQLEQLTEQGWTILVKLHPTVRSMFTHQKTDVHFVTDEYSINDYLLITDVLITDYSSIPFESCLLDIPTLLYTPDIDTYRQIPGIIDSYPNPLPVIYTNQFDVMLNWINSEAALEESRTAMKKFKTVWYTEQPGQATRRIVDHYYRKVR